MRNRWGTTVTMFIIFTYIFGGGRIHQINCDIWFKGGTDTPVWSGQVNGLK